MGEVRPLERSDLQSVADLLVRVFQKRNMPATAQMRDYLGMLFLDLPDKDPHINSLVYANSSGLVVGFIGIYTQRMQLGERRVCAAIGHSLAVSPDAAAPTAGARLCRGFFQGPQDITISDRANTITTALWRSMGGDVLPFYSLDWQRILRPLESATFRLRRRLGVLGPSLPLVRGGDRLVAGLARRLGRKVADIPRAPLRPRGLRRVETDTAGMMIAVRQLAPAFALHPVWSDEGLSLHLGHAAQKKELGQPIQQIVQDAAGRTVGAYIYHLAPHGIAHVLQVLSVRPLVGSVLDLLLLDAYERGGVAIGGRAQPWLMESLMERGAIFSSPARCVFTTRDPLLRRVALEGDALFGGLVGETWPRLHGDRMQ